ncbi:hypothetical protein PF011_g29841 [Phytophthora fragariae]|uniref:Uncharacterized protein n=1 Tax=Phytophthora fragariae TaxID=53985 RepID=A0A6A3GVR1_9STRA|nr:hypothetical protein PF011_g29841 [Phytophthora fragariae]
MEVAIGNSGGTTAPAWGEPGGPGGDPGGDPAGELGGEVFAGGDRGMDPGPGVLERE